MNRTARVLAALLVGAMAVAACGGDDDSGDATDPPTATETSVSGGATTTAGGDTIATDPGSDTTAADPTAAGAADDSLQPVTVGFHNLEGGEYSLPSQRIGFEAGMEYVNAELGGINGHPMDAVICNTDVTPESSINCANQFVEKQVVAAVQGTDFAADAALPILKEAGIIDIVVVALGPAENAATGDAYALYDSTEGAYAAGIVQLKNQGATSIVQVLADVPPNHTVADEVITPLAERLGVDVTVIFYPQPADWATLAATVLASNPDAVTMFATVPDCLAAVPAMRSLGFTGTIVAGVCADIIGELDADVLENVLTSANLYDSTMVGVPESVKGDIEIFQSYIGKHDDVTDMRQAQQGFFLAVQAADILRQVPGDSITAAAVHEHAGSAKGRRMFQDTGYDCSAPTWPNTIACATGTIYTSVTDDKQRQVLPDQPVDLTPALPTS